MRRKAAGLQHDQDSEVEDSAIGLRSKRGQQQLEDDEQRDIENFEDSPRQNDRLDNDDTQKQFMNYNHQFGVKKASQASLGISERSTPQVTVPDMDHDSLLSGNWPIHLGSYNRKKKLIRDVSNKSEQVRQHFLSTGQMQPMQGLTSGLRSGGGNVNHGAAMSGFSSAQNYIKNE